MLPIRMVLCFPMDLEIRKNVHGVIREIKKLYETDIPIFAICLGHQLMALATGADTFKDEIRPPWRQSSGKRSGNRTCVHFLPEPWLCGGYGERWIRRWQRTGICQCKRRNQRRTGLYGQEIFSPYSIHPEACPGPQDSGVSV